MWKEKRGRSGGNQIILKNSFEYKELNDVESFECKQVF